MKTNELGTTFVSSWYVYKFRDIIFHLQWPPSCNISYSGAIAVFVSVWVKYVGTYILTIEKWLIVYICQTSFVINLQILSISEKIARTWNTMVLNCWYKVGTHFSFITDFFNVHKTRNLFCAFEYCVYIFIIIEFHFRSYSIAALSSSLGMISIQNMILRKPFFVL